MLQDFKNAYLDFLEERSYANYRAIQNAAQRLHKQDPYNARWKMKEAAEQCYTSFKLGI